MLTEQQEIAPCPWAARPSIWEAVLGAPVSAPLKRKKPPHLEGFYWSEREDLNLRPLVSQTSALTGLRHAPMTFH